MQLQYKADDTEFYSKAECISAYDLAIEEGTKILKIESPSKYKDAHKYFKKYIESDLKYLELERQELKTGKSNPGKALEILNESQANHISFEEKVGKEFMDSLNEKVYDNQRMETREFIKATTGRMKQFYTYFNGDSLTKVETEVRMKKAENILTSIRRLVPSKEAEELGQYSDNAIKAYKEAVDLRTSDPHLEANGAEEKFREYFKKGDDIIINKFTEEADKYLQ